MQIPVHLNGMERIMFMSKLNNNSIMIETLYRHYIILSIVAFVLVVKLNSKACML